MKNMLTFIMNSKLKSLAKPSNKSDYTKAAIRLQIRSLEKEFGLLRSDFPHDRSSTKGESHDFIDIYKRLIREKNSFPISSHKNFEIGKVIRIGCPEPFLFYRISELIKLFSSKHKDISFSLNTGPFEAHKALLDSGDLDLVFFCDGCGTSEDVHAINLIEETFYLVYPLEYRLQSIQKLSSDLTACFYTDLRFEYFFNKFQGDTLLMPGLRLDSKSIEEIKKIVQSGIGYSILPQMCIIDEMQSRTLNFIKLDGSEFSMSLSIAYPNIDDIPSHVLDFLEISKKLSKII